MKRLTIIVASVLSIGAVGAIGASTASAGSGYLYFGGPPCDVTFDNTGAPTDPTPNGITIDNIVEDSADGDCPGYAYPSGALAINFAGNGLLTGSGSITVTILGFINCTYNAGTITGTNSANTAVINLDFVKTAGPGLCPSSLGTGYLAVTSF